MDDETRQDANSNGGWLALVATPIGNMDDITLRALKVLREADLIAAEDTRRTGKLCSHFDIPASFTSYHAHNEHKKTPWLLEKVLAGEKVAVVTDSGMPAVSDPGFLIAREAVKRDIEPMVVPGPSALTHAVAAAALPVDRFVFLGYPPRKQGKRRNFLRDLRGSDTTVFLYESVHRIEQLLVDIADVLGPETLIAIIREATKVHEERIRGPVQEILDEHAGREWLGEFVVGIDVRE